MKFHSRYTQLFFATLMSYLVLSLERVFLFAYYPDSFASLTSHELTSSLFMGLRVDTAIIFTFFSLAFLLLSLPLKFVYNRFLRFLVGLYWGVMLAVISVVNIADTLYFGFVHRHVDEEMSVIGSDIGSLFSMAYEFYLPQTLLGLLVSAFIIYFFIKIFLAEIEDHTINKKAWWGVPLIILIAFIGIRGKIEGKSFGVSDAFAVNKLASGNLALNGFFCLYRSGSKQSVNHNKVPLKKALHTVKEMIASDKTRYLSNEYPHYRYYGGHTQLKSSHKPNIVIIMVESLSAKYVDAFTHNDFKVTPFLGITLLLPPLLALFLS